MSHQSRILWILNTWLTFRNLQLRYLFILKGNPISTNNKQECIKIILQSLPNVKTVDAKPLESLKDEIKNDDKLKKQ